MNLSLLGPTGTNQIYPPNSSLQLSLILETVPPSDWTLSLRRSSLVWNQPWESESQRWSYCLQPLTGGGSLICSEDVLRENNGQFFRGWGLATEEASVIYSSSSSAHINRREPDLGHSWVLKETCCFSQGWIMDLFFMCLTYLKWSCVRTFCYCLGMRVPGGGDVAS